MPFPPSIHRPDDFEPLPSSLAADHCIPAMIERMVEKYPDNVALTSNGTRLTYREINRRVNALAHWILEQAPGDTKPVALLFEHDLPAILSLLAVLKTGRPYVPLNPAFPPERSQRIVFDAGATLFLVDRANLDAASQAVEGKPVNVQNFEALDLSGERENPNVPIDPDTFAFIMYTSGSTGEPKGVPSTHRHVVTTYIQEVNEWMVSPSDRISTFGTISFGMSRSTLFDALFSGAATCLFDVKRRGTAEIVNWISAEGITVFRAQQSTFRPVFADAPSGMIFENIRLLGISGDVLSQPDVNLFRSHTPAHSVMASAFYSTECGGLLRNYIDRHTPLQGDTLPVGYPWPDKEVLLLDDHGNLVPRGERGQIVVRSANLCSGYWNRPELTAQKFHPDPADPRIQLYFSGDYGRLTEDGALEFLGREDSMVKIRGYRVEISEVETAVKLHPRVKEAFVAALPSRHRAGQKQLVSYIVPKETGLTSWALREHLAAKLPDYMLPSLYVFLASIPVTSHGKVDKDALPPIPERAELTAEDLPADETEQRLLVIWQKAFGQERIGVNDNFFELGGDSLLASAIFVEVERTFRRTYPLNILLKHGTIRRLARIITDPEAGGTTPIIALRASGSRPPIFIFPGGVGDVLMLIGLAEALGEEQPVYGMQAAGFFGKTVYSRRVEEAAAYFVEEIKKIRSTGPYHLAGHSFGGVIAFEVARQLRAAGEAVGLVGLLDSHPPGSIHGGSFRRRMQTHLFNIGDLDWKGKIGYVTRHFQTRASKTLGRFEFFQTLLRNSAVKEVMWEDPFRQTRFAAANYTPAEPYPGPVTIFVVSERPRHIDWDVMALWHKLISGPVERVLVPGDHSSMIKPPHVTELARRMALALDKANS